MNAKMYIPLLGAALACLTGCMTQSRVIPTGATAEVVAGFSQDDIDAVINQAIQNIAGPSAAAAPRRTPSAQGPPPFPALPASSSFRLLLPLR